MPAATPAAPSILIVDDEAGLRTQIKWALAPWPTLMAEDRLSALDLFERERPPIVILDLGLPPDRGDAGEGLATLRQILARQPLTRVIIASGNQDRANARRAIGLGACDYCSKPVDADTLRVIVERAWNVYRLEAELNAAGPEPEAPDGLVAAAPAMRRAVDLARRVAPAPVSVLLTGESGTGKDVLAKAIHRWSPRAAGPFVAINCAAIPETLLESELFGHEKGAFTGASGRQIGKVEQADGGTLFLDEIGDMPAPLQAKLLRFLQERQIERIGGRRPVAVDVRVIAATNRDLATLMGEGGFRQDLFYRLSEIEIALPPLRDRPEDIPALALHLLRKHRAIAAGAPRAFAETALARMQAYPWPGNVRELENRVRRGLTMGRGAIGPADLGLAPAEEEEGDRPAEVATVDGAPAEPLPTLRAAQEKVERELISRTLALTGGNIQQAARRLGISRPTLYAKMRALGIPRDEQATAGSPAPSEKEEQA
ncbi:PEP-CTERM-box response regulator transcription factor [Phaeospirillum tilakii]|uniref:PEP-CTERM-box response regulator transcription factor n=1 Tax=Phaeospirillum tilakii TaxID=741673 RepID=A0ABW5CFV8_9PROT